MSERQPTEHELGLVASQMMTFRVDDARKDWAEWLVVRSPETNDVWLFYTDVLGEDKQFNPLHDHNDLARFVEAMQAAGFIIKRSHFEDGKVQAAVFVRLTSSGLREMSSHYDTCDLVATFWACVDALKEKEERNE